MRKFVGFLILTLLWGSSSSAANVEADDAPSLQTYRQLVQLAIEFLPPAVQEALPSDVKFRTQKGLKVPAQVDGNSIILSSEILQDFVRDPSDRQFKKSVAFTRHPDFKTYLIAAIAHELAHIYDRKTRISGDLEFQLLSYRYTYGADGSARDRGNYFEARSIDPYEFKNQEESFAVNFEFYVLDPEFSCRRPAMARYFAEKLRDLRPESRRASGQCQAFPKLFYLTPKINDKEPFVPEVYRPQGPLYAIHFLLAGAGEGIVSGFGHVMIRLVYCSAERSTASEACLYDVDQHIVLSPAAGVADISISNMAGLTGKYRSAFFANKLSQITTSYNRIEERELISIPMRLSREQLDSVERSLIETHWTYKNKYYFVSNNCAVEILNTLKRGLPELPGFQTSYRAKPFDLFQLLKFENLVDNRSLESWRKDSTKRYYFPSVTPVLEKLAGFVADGLRLENARNYLKLAAADRRAIFLQANRSGTSSERLLKALAALEGNLLMKVRLKQMNFAATEIAKMTVPNENQRVRKEEAMVWLSPPDILESQHYGLPSELEIDRIFGARNESVKIYNQSNKAFYADLDQIAVGYPELARVNESEALASEIEASIANAAKSER